jgi:hypothetical protein
MIIADIAREILSNPFSQSRILSVGQFAHFLEERGNWISEEGLETLEKESLLRPLFRLKHEKDQDHFLGVLISNDSLPSYVAAGRVEFPKPGDFKPWSTFNDGHYPSVSLYYHPAQALMIDRFLHGMRFTLWGPDLRNLQPDICNDLAKHYDRFKEAYCSILPDLETKIGLLMLLETPYAPLYRLKTSLGLVVGNDAKEWRSWREKFTPKDILEKTEMRVEQVAKWRDALALEAINFDPLGNWYMLVRSAKYGKKIRLRGEALRAQNYYEYVALLNLFLKDITGKVQPEPDTIADGSDGTWKMRIYGPDFDINSVNTQRKIIDEYFQIGKRIITKLLLIVEGDTEEDCIPPLCHAMNWAFETDGTLVNLHGVGGLNNLRSILEDAQEDNIIPFVIIDDEGEAKHVVEDLLSRGLLKKSNARIWKKNFEDDNFSTKEIIAAVNEILQESKLSISMDEIELDPHKTTWDLMEKAFHEKYKIPLKERISKQRLANHLIQSRLVEIRGEVMTNKYAPKLEIEKALGEAWKTIFHSPIF